MTDLVNLDDCLLFATPRSGSTPIYLQLAEFLFRERGRCGGFEYLNLAPGVQITPSNWRDLRSPKFLSRRGLEEPRSEDFLALARGLGAYQPHLFFKFFPGQLTPEVYHLLKDRTWIFLERRDLFEQFLSFSLGELRGQCYFDMPQIEKPGTYILHRPTLHRFESLVFAYHARKRQIRKKVTLHYEDWVRRPEAYLEEKLGLRQGAIPSVPLPRMQNPARKLHLFQNRQQIIGLYRESLLQRLYPMSDSQTEHPLWN